MSFLFLLHLLLYHFKFNFSFFHLKLDSLLFFCLGLLSSCNFCLISSLGLLLLLSGCVDSFLLISRLSKHLLFCLKFSLEYRTCFLLLLLEFFLSSDSFLFKQLFFLFKLLDKFLLFFFICLLLSQVPLLKPGTFLSFNQF
jgi:hypothetical protein